MRLLLRYFYFIFIIIAVFALFITKWFFSDTILHLFTKQKCIEYYVETIKNPPTVTHYTWNESLSWAFEDNITQFVNSEGSKQDKKVFLSIGIPSIRRRVDSKYLLRTLSYLATETSEEEQKEIVVVVFLSDLDKKYIKKTKSLLYKNFNNLLQSGFLQVITAKKNYYKKITKRKITFGNSRLRIDWRTKQVFDFNFLFRYCSSLSHYHLQIEDDVQVGKNYFKYIRSYISSINLLLNMEATQTLFYYLSYTPLNHTLSQLQEHFNSNNRWAHLSFSTLGFIGKLFQSHQMNAMATFYNMYFDEQPIDWLINYYRDAFGQDSLFDHTPSLFQHFGLKSSLIQNKDNGLQDRYFVDKVNSSPPTSKFNSVPALLFTASPIYEGYTQWIQDNVVKKKEYFSKIPLDPSVNSFYVNNFNFLHAVKTSRRANNISVIFFSPIDIKFIQVETDYFHINCPKSVVIHAGRAISKSSSSRRPSLSCVQLQKVAVISKCVETIEISLTNVHCLSISFHDFYTQQPFIPLSFIHVSTVSLPPIITSLPNNTLSHPSTSITSPPNNNSSHPSTSITSPPNNNSSHPSTSMISPPNNTSTHSSTSMITSSRSHVGPLSHHSLLHPSTEHH